MKMTAAFRNFANLPRKVNTIYTFMAWRSKHRNSFVFSTRSETTAVQRPPISFCEMFRNVQSWPTTSVDFRICHLPRCGHPSVSNSNEQWRESVGVPQVLIRRHQDVLGPESWSAWCKSQRTTRQVPIQFRRRPSSFFQVRLTNKTRLWTLFQTLHTRSAKNR
jgi:hypothetical protein